jgi:serine/threonine protein kinase/Tol biopolymer transport system component
MLQSEGDKLGHYQILGPLGAGGMGEVYRAHDTQLDRDVAIKVLPHALASDPEGLARFDREAKILAALNHPNIAVIYGLVECRGGRALVMELVEGETLTLLIKRGPMSVKDTCKAGRQIAEALEAAHDKGVVHRDLKPGNIMVTPAGVVKVLDFGLAAMVQSDRATPGDPNNSPTLITAGTMAGTILGTASYMSPEQTEGLPVDKRADIWSFGVVLWEMLTGKRLFEGKSISHTLADVLRKEIDFSNPSAPPPIRELLERCLDRETKTRLRDIGEARVTLDNVITGAYSKEDPPAKTTSPLRKWMPWAVAAVALIVAAVAGWSRFSAPHIADRPLTRLSVDLGPEATRGWRITAVLSPDGRRIVFTGRSPDGGGRQLFTRRLDQAAATPLAGTAGSSRTLFPFFPFFSPDGEWIAFFADGKVKKVSAEGGSAITLGEPSRTPLGGSWGADGNIILGTSTGLMRMPAGGGIEQSVKGGDGVQIFPQVLPGAKAVLFNGPLVGMDWEGLDIGVLQFSTGQTKTLLHGGYWPRYLATSGDTGHLVYMHEGTLYAVGFDPQRLEIRGTPVPLLDDIDASSDVILGGGQFASSETGTFVYLSGRPENNVFPIEWLDAAGKTTPLVAQPGIYSAPRLSPDGTRLAYTVGSSKGANVWVYDLERQTPTQLTFSAPGTYELAWAPDSKHIVFGDGTALWWIRADGSGQPRRLLDKLEIPRPFSFSPAPGKDGRLVFIQGFASSPGIYTLPVDLSDPERPKAGRAESFLVDPKIVLVDPAFSPDGKFLAYSSSESGLSEVFVRPFPGPGGKWRVSTGGGKFPAWSRATHEILFLDYDDHIMAVNYTSQGDTFSPGIPHAWSSTQVRRMGVQQNFDVSSDGKRVVMFPIPTAEQPQGSVHVTFLLNFFDEVRRRLPTGK